MVIGRMKEYPSKIAALLIDLDGTLVDTLPLLFDVYIKFLKQFGIKGSTEEFNELNGPSLTEVLAILQKRYHLKGEIKTLLKQYQADIALGYAGSRLFPDAQKTIKRARSHGLKIGLVSSAERSLVNAFMAGKKIEALFDAVITPEGLLRGKPAPDLYHQALKELDIPAAEALVIEDSANGVQSARKAGISTLWMTQDSDPIEDPSCFKLRNWSDIDQFLERYYD